MKTQKLPFWLLTIAIISTFIVSSCTKETIDDINQTKSTLSEHDATKLENLKSWIDKELLIAEEKIEKARKLGESISKEKTINQSLTASSGGTINVPNDYPTIQKAVDAARPGDTIIVDGGTFGGTFAGAVIQSRNNLTIRGINNATVNATITTWEFDAFLVAESHGITIENFTIQETPGGIFVFNSTGTGIVNNIFYSIQFGVYNINCSNSRIIGNKFYDNGWSLILTGENNSRIVHNLINNADESGAVFLLSNDNYIRDLEVSQSKQGNDDDIAGVVLGDSSFNLFIDVVSKENRNGLVVISFNGWSRDNRFIRLQTTSNELSGIILVSAPSGVVESNLIAGSESTSNGECDLQLENVGINDNKIVGTEIGSTCN